MKRCKNCKLWRPYKGNEPTVPKRSSHACLLRLIEIQRNGETVQQPTMIEQYHNKAGELVQTTPGPHHRKRTGPNFSCEHFAGKRPPILKAKRIMADLGSQTVNLVDILSEELEDVSHLDTPASTDVPADTPA